MVQDVYVFVFPFFPNFGDLDRSCLGHRGHVRGLEDDASAQREREKPSVTESVDDVEILCSWMFMVFMVETLGFNTIKNTIETAAETPGVLCTTFDGRMQLWDIGWSLRSWIEIDYGD